LAVSVVAVSTVLVVTAPAEAADYVTGEWGTYEGASTFWGNLKVGGVYGLCVDPGAEPPESLSDANAKKLCGATNGGRPDATAQIAWLLGRHLEDTDTGTLVSLSQFARAEYHRGIPVTYPARHAQLVAEAGQAGVKDAYVEVDLTAGKVWFGLVGAGQAAKITSGALRRDEADHTAGFAVTVTITSPNARFADGSKTKTATTTGAAGWLGFKANHDLIADEKVTAAIKITRVPQICLMVHEETARQRVVTPLFTDLSGTHAAIQDKTVWQPAVTTDVTTDVVQPGGKVTDKVRAEAVGGSQWPVKTWKDADQTIPDTHYPFTATGELVRSAAPQAASATLPAGAVVLPGEATAVLTGPGVWAATDVGLPAAAGSGHYSLRWCLDKANQTANAKHLPVGGPWCDRYFTATERFTVPLRLGITTQVRANTVAKGEPPDDAVTVFLPETADQWMSDQAGAPITVKAHGTLYGSSRPFAERPDPPAEVVKLGQADIAVTLPTSGREPVTVKAPAGFNLNGSTYWTWVWEIRRADQTPKTAVLLAGDVKDSFGRPTESGWTPMTLAIASTLPDQYRAKTEPPDDTITISLPDPRDQWIALRDGKPAVVKAEGVFYAGSASSFTISKTPPDDAKPLGAASVDVTLPTSGREPVTVDAPAGFTVPTSQYGVWVWRIDRAAQTPQVAGLFDNDPTDLFGQRLETHVTQMDLQLRSQVEHATIPEPKRDGVVEVCDRVWVEHSTPGDLWLNQWGTRQPVEVTVEGKVYHQAVPEDQTLIPDPGVPVAAEWELVFTAAGETHAQTVCHQAAYGDYGAYGFTWSINPDKQPKATKEFLSQGTATPLWLPEETTMVRRVPVIHTAAVQWSTTDNGAETIFLTDEIWQTDWPDDSGHSDLRGSVEHGQWDGQGPWEADGKTITVELWRIEGPATAESCAADNPAARLVAVNQTTPAANSWDGSRKVSGAKFKAEDGPATYTFVVSWPGDARTEPHKSICGEKSETITLTPGTPEFVTELVQAADAKHSDAETATSRAEAITIQPGAELVDALHVWFPHQDTPQTDMTGWTATWEAHWQPLEDGAEPKTTQDDSGANIYEDAVCTPGNVFWTSQEPVPVDKPGSHVSPVFTAPDHAGLVSVVETVTDKTGRVIRRGACGTVSETAIINPPEPKITTTAPEHATVGDKITDLAELTGPYPKGATIEFWRQHTPHTDPDANPDNLTCQPPDPDNMEGATLIGAIVIDHDIPAGTVETIQSPKFTSDKTGCTWIKEIARTPGQNLEPTILAQGRFNNPNERTIWRIRPEAVAGGELSVTGTQTVWGAVLAGAIVTAGGAVISSARRRNHRTSTEAVS
jgi:hypothetical protein